MNYIKKLVENQGKSEDECLSVLGDLNGLNAIANIWGQYADLLHVIGVHEFVEWTKKEFDSKEKTAFEEGLAAFPQFFEKCYKEMKERQRLNSQNVSE